MTLNPPPFQANMTLKAYFAELEVLSGVPRTRLEVLFCCVVSPSSLVLSSLELSDTQSL